MAKTLANVQIYGDLASGVWVAPSGTTGPTTLAAPSGSYDEVGYLDETGIDQERSEDGTTFKAWQGGTIIARKVTNVEDTFKFVCLEENLAVLDILYKGQAPSVTSGVATVHVQNQLTTDERAWVLDFVNGDVTKRIVAPSGVAQLTGTISHQNEAMTAYEFTLTLLGDYYVLSNNPALVGA